MKVDRTLLRTAWLIVALLVPVALLNYLDRQMLASMKLSIMTDIRDIHTDTNWGIMLAQFKWVYAVFSLVGGYVADRFSRKWVITISLLVWSVVTWWTGHAHSYEALLWTRTAMGISEALYIPAALALIVDFHVGATKSKAVGLHMAAIYVGIILGGFTGFAADNPHIGWRSAFVVIGFIGVAYSVPLMFFLKDAPKPENKEKAPPKISILKSYRTLLLDPSFLLLVIYFTLVALPGWMMKDWMPSMLTDHFHVSQGMGGMSAALYVNVAGFGGLFLGGYLSDRWVRKKLRGRLYISAIGMAVLIPALYGLGHSPTLAVAIIFLALFGIGFGFFDCSNMPILAQLATSEMRATGYGIMNFVSVCIGGFADIAIGHLQDRGASFEEILGIGAAMVAVNVVLILLVKPKRELTPELDSLPQMEAA